MLPAAPPIALYVGGGLAPEVPFIAIAVVSFAALVRGSKSASGTDSVGGTVLVARRSSVEASVAHFVGRWVEQIASR